MEEEPQLMEEEEEAPAFDPRPSPPKAATATTTTTTVYRLERPPADELHTALKAQHSIIPAVEVRMALEEEETEAMELEASGLLAAAAAANKDTATPTTQLERFTRLPDAAAAEAGGEEFANAPPPQAIMTPAPVKAKRCHNVELLLLQETTERSADDVIRLTAARKRVVRLINFFVITIINYDAPV